MSVEFPEEKPESFEELQEQIAQLFYDLHHNLGPLEQNSEVTMSRAQRLVVKHIENNIELVKSWENSLNLIRGALDIARPKVAAAWKEMYEKANENNASALPYTATKIGMIHDLPTQTQLMGIFKEYKETLKEKYTGDKAKNRDGKTPNERY